MASAVKIRAVPIIHLGLQGTMPRILRVHTNTSEGTETASTMPARRLDLGLSILSALFSNAEITSPIITVGCKASGGSPSTASRSNASDCPPLCGLIPCVTPLGASHRPRAQDGRGAPRPARPVPRRTARKTKLAIDRPRSRSVGGCRVASTYSSSRRRWEVSDLLGGGPSVLAFLPDLHTHLSFT